VGQGRDPGAYVEALEACPTIAMRPKSWSSAGAARAHIHLAADRQKQTATFIGVCCRGTHLLPSTSAGVSGRSGHLISPTASKLRAVRPLPPLADENPSRLRWRRSSRVPLPKLFSGAAQGPAVARAPTASRFRAGPGRAPGEPARCVGGRRGSSGTPWLGRHLITIALKNNPSGKLSGTDTAHAANGVATFAEPAHRQGRIQHTLRTTRLTERFLKVMPRRPRRATWTVTTATTGGTPDPTATPSLSSGARASRLGT